MRKGGAGTGSKGARSGNEAEENGDGIRTKQNERGEGSGSKG